MKLEKNKYIVKKENPYLKIGTTFTSNWDCTEFYINGKTLPQHIIDYLHDNSNTVDLTN